MRTISVELSDDDERALAHDILDPEQWLREALAGKVVACRRRMLAHGEAVLKADPDVKAIPTDPVELVMKVVEHPGYRNRAQREADEAEKAERIRLAAEALRDDASVEEQRS